MADDFDADRCPTAGVSSALYVLRTTRHLISPRADTSTSPSEIARAVDTADLGLRQYIGDRQHPRKYTSPTVRPRRRPEQLQSTRHGRRVNEENHPGQLCR